MRTLIISVFCGFSLAIAYSSPAAAQLNPSNDQLASSSALLSQKSSLASELPLIQPDARPGAGNANHQNPADPGDAQKEKALAQLRRQLGTRPFGISSACAHIIIYVPPVTDAKMIIKVPGSDKAPESNQDGHIVPDLRDVPSVGVCGEDLRRVDAPHPAPPSNPDGKATLVPVHQPPVPH